MPRSRPCCWLGWTNNDAAARRSPGRCARRCGAVATPFVSFEKHYTAIGESEIFPEPRGFHTETNDRIEKSAITKLIGLLVTYLPKAGFAQTGYIHHYLIYPLAFLIIIGLLTFLNYL